MAEEKRDVTSLHCCVCTERYSCPKLLPCFHTFCLRCVETIAGTRPQFSCPVCRTIVILPPAGAAALQPDVSVEKELVRAMADSDAQCQLCPSSGSPAQVKCLQCQQLYCQPCRQTHDAIPNCAAHTLLSLGEAPDLPPPLPPPQAAGVYRPPRPPRNCSHHKTQPLTLFCRQCDVSICQQCKTTSHGGHDTAVARVEKAEKAVENHQQAKSELRHCVEVLAKQEQALKALLSYVEDFEAQLAEEKRNAESELHDRASKLQSMLLDEEKRALVELDSLALRLQNSVQQQTKSIQLMEEAVRAKHVYIGKVLDSSDENHIGRLHAELKTDDQLDTFAAFTKNAMVESNTIVLTYDKSTIKKADVASFVGSANEGTRKQLTIQTLRALSLMNPAQRERVHEPEDNTVNMKAVGEIEYSRNADVTMTDMCLTSEEGVWVVYNFDGTGQQMALFGKDGRKLEQRYESLNVNLPQHLACEGDTLVLLPSGRFAAPEGRFGELGKMVVDTKMGWLLSKPSPRYYVMQRSNVMSTPQQSPRSSMVGGDVMESVEITRVASLTSSPPKLEASAVCSGIDPSSSVGMYTRSASLFAVSRDEKFFAFLSSGSVYVYVQCSSAVGDMKCIATYHMIDTDKIRSIVDLAFTPVKGVEMLVVVSEKLREVHVVDYRDGCCLVLAADPDDFDPTEQPYRVAANGKGRIWVGCHGGRILVYDL